VLRLVIAVVVLVLFGEVQALDFLDLGVDRAVEGGRGAVLPVDIQVPHPDHLRPDFDDYLLQQLGEGAVFALIDKLVELTGNNGVFNFADVAVPGARNLHEEVEGDLHGAVAHVAADPLQVAVAVPVLQCLVGDVLDQTPVDDRLVTDCGAVIDIGSGR